MSDDWLEIARGGGISFAQVGFSFAMEQAEHVQRLVARSPEFGVTIWGRLPEQPDRVDALVERGIFFDAALAEFAEDAEELDARYARYDAARPASSPVLRGIVVESSRGIEALPAILERARIDLVLPGPFDLSKELGLTPEHPEVQERILSIIDVCAARGVDVIASTTTHPGGPAAAAASSATHLLYPGIRRATELAWQDTDVAVAAAA